MFFHKKKKMCPNLWIKYPDLYPDIISIFRKMKNEITIHNSNKVLFFFTGTNRQVGVSTIAFNLAWIFGWDISDARILLVDANISRPALHESFSIENRFGLTDFLYGNAKISEIFHKTEMNNLDLIPSGIGYKSRSSPFTRISFVDFIENIRNTYNIIFFDTEPILYSEYTKSIISYADGIIVVSEARKTKIDEIRKICVQIKKYNIDYIGNILNRKKIFFLDSFFQ